MGRKFKFKDGSRYAVDAAVAGSELERITARDGALTPAVVVDESRPQEAPLHPVFEWDDQVAGEKYRVHQARNLIRSVQVVQPDRAVEPQYVHVPTSVASDKPAGYYPTHVVVSNPSMYAVALGALITKMHGVEAAAKSLQDAAEGDPDDGDRMARITVAIAAINTAAAAVHALQ